MRRYVWGWVIVICIGLPVSLQAVPLDWRVALDEMQNDSHSGFTITPNKQVIDASVEMREIGKQGISTTAVGPRKSMAAGLPTLALPESGALLLLGLGLAGLASILRRKP